MTFKMVIGNQRKLRGDTADAETVTVIKWIRPNFKTVTVTVIWGKSIFKSNKTPGNDFDSNSTILAEWLQNNALKRFVSCIIFAIFL